MTDLSKTFEPQSIEEKWYAFWEQHGFFQASSSSNRPPYCIVIPPPNVTGILHMGHALVDTLEDILIRYKRMQGFEAVWIPGTDHAGIATQGVVERHLFSQTGKRRHDFSREEFIEHIWDWKEKSQTKILHQLKKLGCSCDWSRLRFTMDEQSNRAVRKVFCKMYNEGLIYRGDYLVNWDPVQQTALSDDEVEREERASFLWYIRYPLIGETQSLIVATTRPETLLGDVALAVHPSDTRYSAWIGKTVQLPLTNRSIPVIGDHFVDPLFGTGVVKLTPAHDFTDYEVAKRHDLPLINILTPDGKINEIGGRFASLSVDDARIEVVNALQSENLIEKIEPYTLHVGVSYRSKAVIQPYLSKQWFLSMKSFKEPLLRAVGENKVRLLPPHWKQTYEHWIKNLRDWCISRQIWWGHQIPIWYHREDRTRLICYEGAGLPPEVAKNPEDWEQDPDVLDTWFSSALWPFSALGWPDQTADLKFFYPTATLITGHDILFFWVARMILMGEYIMKKAPFPEAFLHGLIYGKSYFSLQDELVLYASAEEKKRYDRGEPLPTGVEAKWEKMSKSKGNVIDPIQIIEEVGADALRMTLCASATQARQIDLDPRKFEEFKNFANKIWNGARFALLNLAANDSYPALDEKALEEGLDLSLLTLEDRWILSTLNRTIQELNTSLDAYAFDRAAHRSYDFFWNEFCATYLELLKPVLFGKEGSFALRQNKQKLLAIVLCASIRLMHPIAPFITEEIFSHLKNRFPIDPKKSFPPVDPYTNDLIQALSSPACITAPYPKLIAESDIQSGIEKSFSEIMEVVHSVRKIRAEMALSPAEKTELYVIGSLPTLEENSSIVKTLAGTSKIHFSTEAEALSSFGATALVGSVKLFVPIPLSLRTKEKERLVKEQMKLEKLQISTNVKLSNPQFRERAPVAIVQNLEYALKDTEKKLKEILDKLSQI